MSASRFNWPSSFHAAGDGPEFTPPPPPGLLRAFGIAVLAHLLLLLALTWGLQWKRDSQDMAAEAELWSSVPQQAAPEEVPQPPPPPPQPVVKEQPKPEPVNRDAEIALEQEKKRKAAEERERREALEREKKKKLEAQRKKEEELKKQEQAKLAAENRKKEEDKKRQDKQKEQEQARKLAQLREENLRRIQGMAGGTSSNEQGRAAQSSGPSASWAGRVRARVKPNIVFSDDVSGNPEAHVEVRLSPDGTIVGKRVTKSSGVRAWDDAVLRALDKTEVLPRDVDGRVPSPVTLVFRPKD